MSEAVHRAVHRAAGTPHSNSSALCVIIIIALTGVCWSTRA